MTVSWFPAAAARLRRDVRALASVAGKPAVAAPPWAEPPFGYDPHGPHWCPECRVGWAGEGACWVDPEHAGVPGFARLKAAGITDQTN